MMDTKTYCQHHHIKLTPLREKILHIIQQGQVPVTAYEILDKLKKTNPKAQVMSVYRVINFLLDNGLIHRIESLNAVMSCCLLSEKHISQWLICNHCNHVEEYTSPAVQSLINEVEEQAHFTVTSPTIELVGICLACKTQGFS